MICRNSATQSFTFFIKLNNLHKKVYLHSFHESFIITSIIYSMVDFNYLLMRTAIRPKFLSALMPYVIHIVIKSLIPHSILIAFLTISSRFSLHEFNFSLAILTLDSSPLNASSISFKSGLSIFLVNNT